MHLVKLSPFLASAIVFLLKFCNANSSESMFLVSKCLPLVSLCLFVMANGALEKNNYYAKRILLGLFISGIADVMIEKFAKFLLLLINAP